jgi:hypothetical protein
MKAEVYYRNSFGLVGSVFSAPTNKVWEGEVEANHADYAGSAPPELEVLFERFNIGDHGGLQIRSMSVGDLVKLDGVLWECDPCGWRKLSNEA